MATVALHQPLELAASAAGYVSQRRELRFEQGRLSSHASLALTLERGGEKLSGRISDVTGGGLAGARISVEAVTAPAPTAVTEAGLDGSFELTVARGPLRVCARAEHYAPACKDAMVPSTNNDLALVPEATIVGRVLDRNGSPLLGATVTADRTGPNWSEPTFQTSTSADGSFELGVAPGAYRLVATAPERRSQEERVRVGLGAISNALTLVAHEAASLHGVARVSGVPCERGSVMLSGPVDASGTIGTDGHVKIDALPAGQYQTVVRCPNALHDLGSVEIGRDSVSVAWELESNPNAGEPGPVASEPVGEIRARLDLSEQPSASLEVFAALPHAVRSARRDGDEFVFEQLPLGEYRVFAGDAQELGVHATIAHPGDLVRVNVRSGPGARIEGRVLSIDGEPVPDTWVAHYAIFDTLGVHSTAAPVLTDEDGRFTFTGSQGVRYSLVADGPRGTGELQVTSTDRSVVLVVQASL